MSAVAAAIVGSAVVGGLVARNAQKGAAKSAAKSQQQSTDASVDEQRRQFDAFQKLLNPYVKAGNTALTEQLGYLGLSGDEKQQQMFDQLEQSPEFESIYSQGENAILQNASATGGLRGGNTQAALSQFRPEMLRQLFESKYSKLNNLMLTGQNSAAGVGAAGQAMGANIGNAFANQGNNMANAALAGGAANANMYSGIAGSVGLAAGMGAFGGSGAGAAPVQQPFAPTLGF